MLKLIHSQSDLTSMNIPINLNAMVKGILIRISGMNSAAAIVKGDIGRIQVLRGGSTIVDAGADFLYSLNQHIGGYCNFVSGIAGGGGVEAEDTNYSIYIPCRYYDDNVMLIKPEDKMNIRCNFNANLDTRITSAGLVEVFLDLELGIQKYVLNIHQFSETIAGASTRPQSYDAEPNILMCLVSATVSSVLTLVGSNLTDLNVEIGNEKGVYSLGSLVDITTFEFEHEASYLISAIPFASKGDITTRLHDIISLNFVTSGACNPEIMLITAAFENETFARTVSLQRKRLTDRMAHISKMSSPVAKETVAVVRRLSGVTG